MKTRSTTFVVIQKVNKIAHLFFYKKNCWDIFLNYKVGPLILKKERDKRKIKSKRVREVLLIRIGFGDLGSKIVLLHSSVRTI